MCESALAGQLRTGWLGHGGLDRDALGDEPRRGIRLAVAIAGCRRRTVPSRTVSPWRSPSRPLATARDRRNGVKSMANEQISLSARCAHKPTEATAFLLS